MSLSLSLSLPQAAVKGTDQPCRPTPARRTPSAALRSESESESARTSPRRSIRRESGGSSTYVANRNLRCEETTAAAGHATQLTTSSRAGAGRSNGHMARASSRAVGVACRRPAAHGSAPTGGAELTAHTCMHARIEIPLFRLVTAGSIRAGAGMARRTPPMDDMDRTTTTVHSRARPPLELDFGRVVHHASLAVDTYMRGTEAIMCRETSYTH